MSERERRVESRKRVKRGVRERGRGGGGLKRGERVKRVKRVERVNGVERVKK